METSDTTESKRLRVYEIGYLLLPTIPEEHLAIEVQKIKTVIENHEGVFITEDFPKLRTLAYTMRKVLNAQKIKFDKAYFGWIKFETPQNLVPAIQIELDKNSNILRCMVVSTVRENTMFAQKTMFRSAVSGEPPKSGEKVKMTEEEMDKTIANLVVE